MFIRRPIGRDWRPVETDPTGGDVTVAKKKATRKKATRKKAAVKKKAARKKAAAKPDDLPAPEPEVFEPSRVKCAKAFGIAPSTLRQWMEHPAFPDCSAGHPMNAIRQWRDDYRRKGAEDISDHEDDARSEILAKTELEKLYQAEIKTMRDRLALQLQEGELAWRRSLELAFATVATEQRDGLELIATTLPSTAGVPKKYQSKLRAAMRTAFAALQQQIRVAVDTQLRKLDEQQGKSADTA